MTHVAIETALSLPADLPVVAGTCAGSSDVVPSLSAWQCQLATPRLDGVEILDPCLQQPDGTLVCNPTGDAFVLESADGLPAQTTTSGRPTEAPWRVTIPPLSGAANNAPLACQRDLTPDVTVDGRTIGYLCGGEGADGGRDVLLGDPASGDLWTATLARITAQGDGWHVEAERVVALGGVRIYASPLDSAVRAGFGATNVIDYVPTRPDGPVQQGTCFGGALAVTDPHAWRCMVDDSIYDPCFEIPGASNALVCEPDPLAGSAGFVLQLTEPLPLSGAALMANDSPWLVELEDGARCGVATGATGGVNGQRINYLCTSETRQLVGLLGTPQPGLSAGDGSSELWSALRAVVAMGENGPYATELGWVPVRTAVRGPRRFVPWECDGLADDVARLLNTTVVTSTAPFDDYVSGGSGTACMVEAKGDGTDFPDLFATASDLRTALIARGWQEDIAYQAGGPTGEGMGFRQGGVLCLLNLGWSPTPGLCPGDRPISACELAPEDRHISITLLCARDVYGDPAATEGGAASPSIAAAP